MKLFVVAFCVGAALAARSITPPADGGFSAIDTNGDGKIDRAELTALFNAFDDNSSGFVDFIEFTTQYSMRTGLSLKDSAIVFYLVDVDESGALTTDELEDIFINFGPDGNGEVTLVEFEDVMAFTQAKIVGVNVIADKLEVMIDAIDDNSDGILTPAELGKFSQGADINPADGKVSEAEFVAWWKVNIEDDEPNAIMIMFGLLDLNGDGFYDGGPERLALLATGDNNGDGNVSKDELNYLFNFLAGRETRAA